MLPPDPPATIDAPEKSVSSAGQLGVAEVHNPAVAALEQAQAQMLAEEGSEHHRRGTFYQLTGGQTYGNGRKEPSTVANGIICPSFTTNTPTFTAPSSIASGPPVPSIWAHGHTLSAIVILQTGVQSLGNFDYTKGRHLVLWECKLEFPPGSTILIPSAALFHSNTIISAGERRYSFTQYTAGGLFRWVERGFKSETEARASGLPLHGDLIPHPQLAVLNT
ncbi:hypothetical protein R3P38DRAFT_3203090 [Favolaschia claudopus]|uniref:Uncharacterized protein n=1 Tax=Favolaschia claudopus TaxID=2862362 RepID=A0AAW0AT52_9AGAR